MRLPWESHEDRAKVQPMPVSVVVVGSKFDLFVNTFEPVKKKYVCLSLRYICHTNGCDLVFSSVKGTQPSHLFQAMLTRYLADATPPRAEKIDRDPNNLLSISAGADTLSSIGEPEGAGMRKNVAFEKLWQELVETQVPKIATVALKDPTAVLGDMRRFAEDKVDSMRTQKDEELEQYKKEIERAERAKRNAINIGATTGAEKVVVKRKVVAPAGQP
jgi:dynein light intermediate chain 2, cytosolic